MTKRAKHAPKKNTRFRCETCGSTGTLAPCEQCGSEAVVPESGGAGTTKPDRETLDRVGPSAARIAAPCPLLEPVGNEIDRDAFVVVTGPRGSGKSTQCARAVVALTRKTKRRCCWIDGEMTGPRVRDLFERVQATAADLRRVERKKASGLGEAIEILRSTARKLIVIDSLHALGVSDKERKILARECRRKAESGLIVLLIAHESKKGDILGTGEPEQRGDALIRVTKEEIYSEKCRWFDVAGSSALPRARRPAGVA